MSFLLHAYAALRLVPAVADWPVVAVLSSLLLAASAAMVPLGLLRRRSAARRALSAWSGVLAMGWLSSLLVLTLARDVLLMLAALVAWLSASGVVGTLVPFSALCVLGGSLLVTGIGAWNALRTAAVVRVDVPITGLPGALEGFRIAQISDVHVGPTIRSGYVRAIVERVNRLDADMVAITGDLVDGSVAELSAHVAPLAGLASRHGTFFVTGNHEYYSGAQAWIAELRRIGLRVLLNEHALLRHGEGLLVVAGVTDYSAHHFDPAHRSAPDRALDGAPENAVRMLLAHQPRTAMAAADAGYDLQLSGHTHGGQFWPWNHFVRFQQPFTAGLHRLKSLWVYTSRGTGYWGPPKRFGAPSEITELRLVRA